MSTVAWMAAAVVFAFMRAFVRARAFPPVAVMAAAATLVLVLLRQVRGTSIPVPLSLSLSVPLAGLAGGTRAAARPFPFVGVSAVLVQIVWALLWLQVWQEGRRRAVVGVSPWWLAAAVRAATGARAVGAWVTVPVIVTRGKTAIEYRHRNHRAYSSALQMVLTVVWESEIWSGISFWNENDLHSYCYDLTCSPSWVWGKNKEDA